MISEENCTALKKRIRAALTDYEYRVFMMYADGESPQSISKALDKNAKSVYNTLQRVRKKLKIIV